MPRLISGYRLVPSIFLSEGPGPASVAPRWAVVASVILTIGLLARLQFYLSAPSYWYDEAYVLLNVFNRTFANLLGAIDNAQVAPPIFLWVE